MKQTTAAPNRYLSVDFFRGITMFLLVGEFSGLFEHLVDPPFEGTIVAWVAHQFHHHPWHGLRFWDLVQPFFMFIVGVSLAFSVTKRLDRGDGQKSVTRHVVQRSIALLLVGWGLYCIDDGEITWRFQNVLAQMSVTYLIAYLIMNRSFWWQVVFSVILLVVADAMYRLFPLEGFNQPFTPNHNLGEWIELQLNGKLPGGHWVSINALSTTAHTIWGVLAGKLLLSELDQKAKLKQLLVAGALLLAAGYAFDLLTPIIKRIATSTFVLASGGWTLVALAFSYWLIDIKKKDRVVLFFAIVGMNPLFIYLFAHVGGARMIERILHPFTHALFGWSGEASAAVLTSLAVWASLWYMCFWLYRKRIFLRI